MWSKLSIFQLIILMTFIGLPLASMAAYLIVRAVMDAVSDSRLRSTQKFLLMSKKEGGNYEKGK